MAVHFDGTHTTKRKLYAMALSLDMVDDLRRTLPTLTLLDDDATLAAHSYDWWPVAAKWRMQGKMPTPAELVALPTTTEEVAALLKWAGAHSVAVTPWGRGSSVTGAPLPMQGGIVLDMSAMEKILVLDDANLFVTVQAGIWGHKLEEVLNARGLTLNHSPQSLDRSSPGGWVATRATGQFSSKWGGIEDLCLALTVVLGDGTVVRTPLAPRASMGPEMRNLFIGSEGTLGIVTEVSLRVFPVSETRRLEAVAFDDVKPGLDAVRLILRAGLLPFLVRLYDAEEARHALHAPQRAQSVLFLGFEGPAAVAEAEHTEAMRICAEQGGRTLGSGPVEAWMARRFDFSTIENLINLPGGMAETIEVAHFWDGIFETYTRLKAELAPYADEVLGHFSHVYPQGSSLYIILLGQAASDAEAEARLHAIWDTSMRICLETGAALSHHHGVGLARRPYLADALGSSYELLVRLKHACDPQGILNPDKL